ncbi:YybH family protein [Terricaulis sp.]|uniref:YybH family protein n=1 Tax=Terricaulis sp. TaxID=2768686 RepID=UPI003784B6B2
MRILFAALALLVVAACDPQASTRASVGPRIGDKIREQETAMNVALDAKDADALVAFYAPDAQLFNAGQPAATTPEQIRASFAGLFSDGNGALSFETTDVILPSAGDYAVTQGTYTLTYTDPQTHQPVTMNGNYITLWRHQDDDSWKVIRDISTPGLQAAATP